MTRDPADRCAMTAELVAALRSRIDDLARALLGKPNRAKSGKRELRFGSKGALCVWIAGPRRGGWADFSGDAKGDPIGLIRYARRCDFLSALAWARTWLGWPHDSSNTLATRQPPPPDPTPIDNFADAERRAEIARRLWHEAEPIGGSVAERYLVEVRKIPAGTPWPRAVRYHRGTRSLILAATNDAGIVRAVQMVRLTASARAVQREDGSKLKISRGCLAGVAVRLPGSRNGGLLLLAEGPETGLSVWRASGWDTWIALGSMSRFAPPADRPVIVCADDDVLKHQDRRKLAAARALLAAAERWRGAGVLLAVATPNATRRQDKTDFNDLLQSGGIGAVWQRLILAERELHRQLAEQRIPRAIAGLLHARRPSHEILAAADAANIGNLLSAAEVRAAYETHMLAHLRHARRHQKAIAA